MSVVDPGPADDAHEPVDPARDPEGGRTARRAVDGRRPAVARHLPGRGASAPPATPCSRQQPQGSAAVRRRARASLPLREWVAAHARRRPATRVTADQVLITTGSQQGLDLVGKVLHRRRRAGGGRSADLPRRAAGVRALRAGVRQPRRATPRGRGPSRSRRCRDARPGHPLRLPAAELPEPDRRADFRRPPRRHRGRGAVGRRADRRRQPVRRPLVRPGAAARR